MDRADALKILDQYIGKPSLQKHMLSVEAAMRFYATLFGEDIESWGIVGLLHDFDYEIHSDLTRHPQDGAPLLRQAGVPEEYIQAVLSHADHCGIPRDSLLRKTLYACDELTGLITAVVLVRPSRSILDMTVSSVKKKWKDLSFAAGADREQIARGARELEIELWEHVDNVIHAMKVVASELGLSGETQSMREKIP